MAPWTRHHGCPSHVPSRNVQGIAADSTMDDNHSLVNNGPWTKEEHEKFLKALEKYGNLSSGSELSKMASEIGNGRTVTDVWKHAEKYLLKLQRAKTEHMRKIDEPRQQLDDGDWTWDQEMAFEHALSVCEPSPSRWSRVAKSVKGKSAEQCKKRYQLLVLDIASISSGEKIEVAYVH